jgi:hypothetical protein
MILLRRVRVCGSAWDSEQSWSTTEFCWSTDVKCPKISIYSSRDNKRKSYLRNQIDIGAMKSNLSVWPNAQPSYDYIRNRCPLWFDSQMIGLRSCWWSGFENLQAMWKRTPSESDRLFQPPCVICGLTAWLFPQSGCECYRKSRIGACQPASEGGRDRRPNRNRMAVPTLHAIECGLHAWKWAQ